MKKRIISVILMFILFVGCVNIPTSVSADSVTYSAEALEHMKNLGIIPASLDEDSLISRADFAKAIYAISGRNTVISFEQIYYDVTENDEFSNAVMYCSKNGYMVGSDNMFRPNDTITYIEAMTVIARVLNYTEYAKNHGDYTLGYYTTAKNLGLLNNTGIVSSSDIMDVKSCASMLYNALRTSVNRLSAINPLYHIYHTLNKTYAYDTLGLNYGSGILTSNGYMDVTGKEYAEEHLVIIGGVKYSSRLLDDSFRKYVGQEVSVFYDDDTNIVSVAPTGKSTKINVLRQNFGGKSGNTIKYYINDTQYNNLTLDNKAIYFKNGKVVADYKATGFDSAEYADITFVDGDGDNFFECVFVNVYDTFVVGSVSTDGVIRSIDNKSVYDLSEENSENKNIFVYNADGERKSFEYIKPDCTVSVIENDKCIYVVYTENMVSGILEEKDEYEVTVDSLAIEVVNGTKDKLSKFSLGDGISVFFDYEDRLVYARKYVTTNGESRYGYLVDGHFLDKNLEKSIKLKIYTNDEEFKTYSLYKTFKVNDKPLYMKDVNKDNLPAEIFASKDVVKNTIIFYELNDKEEITKITFPKQSSELGTDEDGFIQTASNQKAYRISNGALTNTTAQSDGTYFSGLEFLNSNTEIFVVPDKLSDEEKFAVISMSDIPVSTNYNWDTFHLSKYNGFVDIAIVYSDYAAVSYDTAFSVVLSVSKALKDEEEVFAIKHFSNNKEVVSYASLDLKITEVSGTGTAKISIGSLKSGDGVRLTVGKNGNIRQGERIYEYNATSGAFKGTSKGGPYATHSLYITSGYVAYNDKTMFRLADTKENAIVTGENMFKLIGCVYSSAKIVVVEDSARGVAVRTGTSADIEIGDYVVYQSRAGAAAYVIVYKDKQ